MPYREVRAGDGFQIVQDEQVMLSTQAFGDHELLLVERIGLDVGVVVRAIQLLGNLGKNLLERPGSFIVAEVEGLLYEACRVPPGAQVFEQRGFACAAHAANEQEVACYQQVLLDLQDIDVPSDKAVS